jgi:hypothetical protein
LRPRRYRNSPHAWAFRSHLQSSNEPVAEANLNAALAAVTGIAPQDEAEAMLAAQMVGVHWTAMALLRKANDRALLNDAGNLAVKLLRTYTTQLEALRACLTRSSSQLLRFGERRSRCGQTRTGRNTRMMGDVIRATCGMGYHRAPVQGVLYLHCRYAGGGERLFLPGAYGLPVASAAERLRCAPDGAHLV